MVCHSITTTFGASEVIEPIKIKISDLLTYDKHWYADIIKLFIIFFLFKYYFDDFIQLNHSTTDQLK